MNSEFGSSNALEQRQTCSSESAAQIQRNLGDPRPASSLSPNPRIGAVWPWHRQQVAGLRPAQVEGSRRPHGERIAVRAIVVQQKTSRPVQFEITESTRTALVDWIRLSGLASENFLFPSRVRASPHLSVRQYARIVDSWVEEIGLDPAAYGTHSIRRTKPSLIYRRTKNLRAVQLLLGHTKLESTVRYLGIGGAQHCEATRPRALNAETFPLTTTSVDAAIRNDRFTSKPVRLIDWVLTLVQLLAVFRRTRSLPTALRLPPCRAFGWSALAGPAAAHWLTAGNLSASRAAECSSRRQSRRCRAAGRGPPRTARASSP